MTLTLMAVHAHPDDEATTTGGVLARYGAEGLNTVLVTCTNGELGDAPGGAQPGQPGHDEATVVEMRHRELAESVRILGIGTLEMLGYRDSGMMGWESNKAPGAFWNQPVEEAARPLAELLRRPLPDLVDTKDHFGFYGHPDHIQAHRITVAALRQSESKARLYFPAIRRSALGAFRERMEAAGVELPPVDEDERFGVADEEVAVSVDVRAHVDRKLDAVRAHASQGENLFFLRLPQEVFTELFGTEEFVRGDGTRVAVPDDDLFAGLRSPSPR